MKNFTNNFKQFTSRLSARWLIMALMMLMGTSSAWARNYDGTEKLYFKMDAVSWWICGTDGNQNFAYFFNGSKNAWSGHAIKQENNIYYVVVPKGDWTTVILTRNSVTSGPSFGNKYNQTGDITINASKNYIEKFSENSTSATWSTYTPPATVTGYELAGFSDAGWTSPIPMTLSNSKYSCTTSLLISDYIGEHNGFKILERYSDGSTKYYGNNGSMTRGECTGWTMDSNTSTANCGLYTDVAGDYTFTFDPSTKKLTVTFPTACTPPTNNNKVVIKSTSRAYVYAWTADANETALLGGWPGTQMSNTTVGNYYSIEIPTETDVKIILHNKKGQQTGDIGPLTKGKEYTYQFTLGGTTYKELRSTCLEPGCDNPAKPTIKINGETGTVSTCGTDGTLTIDANHVADSYNLFTKSGSNYTDKGTISNKTIQITTNGTYVVRAYNGECMTESDPITFTKNTKPSISALSDQTQTICDGTMATLTVTSGKGTYTWVNTNASENISDTDNSVQVSTAGTYTVTATDGNNCSSNAVEFTVTVKELQGKPVFDNASKTVCESTQFTLPSTDKKGATLVWYTSAGASQNTSISGITEQTIYYAAIADNGTKCETASNNRTAYTVKVDKKPNLELTSTTETICQGTEITLSDYVNNNTKVGTVKWYSDENRNNEITKLTLTPSVGENKYYASATNGVCTTPAKADLTVTVNPIPSITGISASDNGKICSGSSVNITVSATNAASYQLYIVKGGTYEAVGDEQTKNEFSVNEAGNYAVKALNGTCESPYSNISITNKQTLTTANFTITIPEDYNVNDGGEEVSVTPNVDGVGEITISYYKDAEKLNETPNSIGTYTVKMSVSEGTEYCEMEETEIGSFSILCAEPRPVYYSIELPETVYNGEKQETRIVLYAGAGELLGVKYKLNEEWVDPVNVGVYGVYVTVAEGSVVCAVQDYYAGDFEITCAPATKDNYEITNASLYYDGTVKTPTVSPKSGAGAVSETKYKKGGNEVEPIDSGTYEVWIKSEVGANYCAVTEWLYVGDFSINCPKPESPSIDIVSGVITCNGALDTEGKIQITNYISTNKYYIGNNNDPILVDNDGFVNISTTSTTYFIKTTNICGVTSDPTEFTISVTDNKPTITGNTSIQPGGIATLTSDKGASTTWVALDGGELSGNSGASVTFSSSEKGQYRVKATYEDCETIVTINVQDDVYIWVRRPIKKEAAYDAFYKNTTTKGGALYYKEFSTKPNNNSDSNQGGRTGDTCTDKDGYTWDGFVVSPEAKEGNYYFTVHAANESSKTGNDTHTFLTQLNNPQTDLYFVMDETGSGNVNGWNINAPVVVRASGDAKFNANNFADFVPLYVKDANICGKEVVSFEWQKSTTQNGAYTTYNGKSGEGINNIRTREAGWYRCVVTYAEGKGTATSNAIEVTNTTSNTPTTLADFSSKLPVIMVNTNGVGFPKEPASGFPSVDANNLKAKVSVDVIIKKGDDIVYDRKARMNYRGSSSLNFKKKSYAFVSGQDSCVFDKSRHDYVKTKKEKMLNLLGDANYTTSDKDWVLYAATPDPSMMRNRLVFDLYQQMRQGEWGVHSTYVELIVDGEYQGVYVFMDKITANEGRVNITNSDGFIVKYDKTDVADRVEKSGDQKTFATTRTGTKNSSDGITSYDTKIDQRFEIEYPEKEDIEDAGGSWEAFYKKVQQRFEDFETALANKQYDKVRDIIDYDSWADWFILSEFIKNQDGFRASNIFIYNGGKIIATPLWDQELSMDNRTRKAHGSTDPEGLLSTTSSVYSDAFPAPFWFTGGGASITGGLLNDPCFVALVKSKWDDYQADVLSASNCSTLVAKYDGELDNNIRSREATKWPYTQAARGTTNSEKYMGYYNDKEGDPSHYSYNASKKAITDYASERSTELKDNVGGLGEAIFDLNGETLIFNIKPNIVETSPWQQSIVTVNAPEGYEYVLDYSALPVGAEVKENGNAYTIKIPRPSDWEISGNGNAKKKTYTITATIDAEGENSCGAKIENTANATINVNDVTEDCDPPIVKP